jgi:hypothetical protein
MPLIVSWTFCTGNNRHDNKQCPRLDRRIDLAMQISNSAVRKETDGRKKVEATGFSVAHRRALPAGLTGRGIRPAGW